MNMIHKLNTYQWCYASWAPSQQFTLRHPLGLRPHLKTYLATLYKRNKGLHLYLYDRICYNTL